MRSYGDNYHWRLFPFFRYLVSRLVALGTGRAQSVILKILSFCYENTATLQQNTDIMYRSSLPGMQYVGLQKRIFLIFATKCMPFAIQGHNFGTNQKQMRLPISASL